MLFQRTACKCEEVSIAKVKGKNCCHVEREGEDCRHVSAVFQLTKAICTGTHSTNASCSPYRPVLKIPYVSGRQCRLSCLVSSTIASKVSLFVSRPTPSLTNTMGLFLAEVTHRNTFQMASSSTCYLLCRHRYILDSDVWCTHSLQSVKNMSRLHRACFVPKVGPYGLFGSNRRCRASSIALHWSTPPRQCMLQSGISLKLHNVQWSSAPSCNH